MNMQICGQNVGQQRIAVHHILGFLMKVDVDSKLAFTINETCEVSGLGRNTVYRLIGRGELPSRMVGGRRLILKEDLQSVLKGTPVTMPA
jgi:excisionase family DNA binding protein